jgi:hypothetical protein
MSILERYLEDPAGRQAAFLDDVLCWVLGTLVRLRLPNPESGTAAPLPVDLQNEVARATVAHVRRQVEGVKLTSFLKYLRKYFADPTDPTNQDNSLKTYVAALSCYLLAQLLTETWERTQALEWLGAALGRPIEAVLGPKTRWAIGMEPAVADAASKNLVTTWTSTPPNSFEDAVRQARDQAVADMNDWMKKRRKQQSAYAMIKRDPGYRWQHDPILASKFIRNELLEALYPLTCRVARRLDNDRGQQLLPWLVLGGVAHTARCERRANVAPHLVQPALIEILKKKFGNNFIRNVYARRVSRLFDDQRERYWDLARWRLLELLGLQLFEEQVRYWEYFIGPDSRAGIAGIDRHCRLQMQSPVGREQADREVEAEGEESAFPPPGLGWELFLENGELTFRKLSEKELTGTANVENAFSREDRPEQVARHHLQGLRSATDASESAEVPSRKSVAGIAGFFCRRTKTLTDWTGRIQAFAGSGR